MEFNWLIALGLFIAATLLDAVFALYTVAVVKTQPFRAASLSFFTYTLEAVGVVNYVNNKWYLIPLALGAFVGSYTVVKWEAIKKDRSKIHEKRPN
jgi:uncharacterized protein YebE (UPF0316 family)